MDNNKEFIRLDEAFKGLQNMSSEQYKAASWNKMRDLLDKEMPQKDKKHRFLLPLFGLLLVAGLAGGGVYMMNSSSAGNGSVANKVAVTENLSATSDMQQQASETLAMQESPAVKSSEDHDVNEAVAVSPVKNAQSNKQDINGVAQAIVENKPTGGETLAAIAPKAQPTMIRNASAKKAVNTHATQSRPTMAQHQPAPTIHEEVVAMQEQLPVIEKEEVIEQIKTKSNAVVQTKSTELTAATVAQKHNLKKTETTLNNQPIYENNKGGLYKEQKDTFNRVVVSGAYKTNVIDKSGQKKQSLLYDTVEINKVAKISFIPLSPVELRQYARVASINNQQLIPNYHIAAENPKTAETVAAREIDKASMAKSSSVTGFKKMLNNTVYHITELLNGNDKWYMAVQLGANSGASNPASFGMQAGVNFVYSMNNKWLMSLGLRYKNRFYPNYSFADSSLKYNVVKDEQEFGTVFSGTEYMKVTDVTIDRLNGLSMPVLFGYNAKKLVVYAGPELSFLFPMVVQGQAKAYENHVSKEVYNNKNPFTEKTQSLNIAKDFGSRFGMGYSVGLGYNFSKKLTMDLRLNQMVWDNMGRYKMDALRKIYRQPNLEVNFNFYLGKREKVVYFMDR